MIHGTLFRILLMCGETELHIFQFHFCPLINYLSHPLDTWWVYVDNNRDTYWH